MQLNLLPVMDSLNHGVGEAWNAHYEFEDAADPRNNAVILKAIRAIPAREPGGSHRYFLDARREENS